MGYKQVRDHHNYDDGDEDDDDVLCDTRAPPRGTLLHAAAGRTRARHRGGSYSSSRSSRYLDHAIHIHVALRANEHDNASPCCSSTCGFRTCRGAIQRQHHRNAACLRTCRGGCRGALSHRRGAPSRRPGSSLTPASSKRCVPSNHSRNVLAPTSTIRCVLLHPPPKTLLEP